MLNQRERHLVRLALTFGALLGLLGCGGPAPEIPDSIEAAPMCPSESVNGWSGMGFRDCGSAPYTGQRCVTDCQVAPLDGSPARPVAPGCWFGGPGFGPAFCHASCDECPAGGGS